MPLTLESVESEGEAPGGAVEARKLLGGCLGWDEILPMLY